MPSCAGVPSHLHMNQDQRSAPRVLKRVCGGHDTRTNNRSQLCKSRCGGVMSWKKRRDRKRGRRSSRKNVCARACTDNPVNVFKKRAAVAHNFENFRYSYNYGRTNRDPDTSSMYHVANNLVDRSESSDDTASGIMCRVKTQLHCSKCPRPHTYT